MGQYAQLLLNQFLCLPFFVLLFLHLIPVPGGFLLFKHHLQLLLLCCHPINFILLPRGSIPSGSEAPSWLPSPPSSRCGSPSRSTTSAAHPSSTASASKRISRRTCIHSIQLKIHSNQNSWLLLCLDNTNKEIVMFSTNR